MIILRSKIEHERKVIIQATLRFIKITRIYYLTLKQNAAEEFTDPGRNQRLFIGKFTNRSTC